MIIVPFGKQCPPLCGTVNSTHSFYRINSIVNNLYSVDFELNVQFSSNILYTEPTDIPFTAESNRLNVFNSNFIVYMGVL